MSRKWWRGVFVAILAGLAAHLAAGTSWLAALENGLVDLWHRQAGVRTREVQAAIVAIDDPSLLKFSGEPLVFWGPHFARALDTLRRVGAGAVGLDFLFSLDAETWLKRLDLPESDQSRTFDLPFRAQLAVGRVALIAHLAENEQKQVEVLLPILPYLAVLPQGINDVGLANLMTDRDGVVRHFWPAFFPPPAQPRLGLATLLAVEQAGLDPASSSWSLGGLQVEATRILRPIGFVGPPLTIPRVSFVKLLEPEAHQNPEVQALKGKVVIIGAEHTGNQDVHLTPYARNFFGWEGGLMSGPEVHANIVQTLLTGVFPRPLPRAAALLILALVLALGTASFLVLSPWRGAAAGLGLGALTLAGAALSFHWHWLVPTLQIDLALALSFLGTLAFRLTGEERQRAFLQHLFGRYVSADVVDKLLAEGTQPRLGGEVVNVTVLFTDIRNFTTTSERLAAPEVVELLNRYLSRMSEPVLARGGMVDKFIGDAVMAVFGAPAPFPDHARRALASALEMAARVAKMQAWMAERFAGRHLPEFHMGIGVHTGPAVVGNIGSDQRTDFTAIGDTVNLASRLEGKTKDLGWNIVASEATVTAAGKGVITGNQAKIHVKGREAEITVYEIVGLAEDDHG